MRLVEWVRDVRLQALREVGRRPPEEIERDPALLEAPLRYKLAHLSQGRIRVSAPILSSHRDLARGVEERLYLDKGVSHVRSNAWCGSLLVVFDPGITDPKALLRILDETPLESFLRWRREHGARVLAPTLPANRNAYIYAGHVFVALGAAGIALPILPGAPLLILAGACYLRGSARLYSWLIHHPVLGNHVRDYYEGRGIPLRARLWSIALVWLGAGVSISQFHGNGVIVGMLLAMATGTTLYLLSQKTRQPAPEPVGMPGSHSPGSLRT